MLCLICYKSRVNRNRFGVWEISHCVFYLACMLETWNTMNRDISRVHEMCVGGLELSHWMTYDVNAFPIVYAVGGWWTNPRYIGIRDTRAGDQLNVALYVKNHELTEYVRCLVNITLCDFIWHVCSKHETNWTRDISMIYEMCVGGSGHWLTLLCLRLFP